MKKKFNLVNKFLSGYGLDKIEFGWTWYSYDTNEPEWEWYSSSLKYERKTNIPQNILTILVEVLQNYWEEPLKHANSDSETYQVEVEIYPKESKWVIKGLYQDDASQEESHEKEIEDEEFNEYLDEKDIEFVKADYDGGGDSGWISKVEVDGKDLGDGNRISQNQEYKELTDELYNVLESRVSGWEIDDGSNGKIELIKRKGENAQISIEHTWFMREFFDADNDFVLTKETFNDEE